MEVPKRKYTGRFVLGSISIAFNLYLFLGDERAFFTMNFLLFFLFTWGIGWYFDRARYYDQKARFNEGNYRRLVDVLPEAVFIQWENKILYVNQAAIHMMGANNKEQLVNSSFGDLLVADYVERWKVRMETAKKETNPLSVIEYKMKRLDGSVFFYESTCLAVSFEGSKAILSIGKDITESKSKTIHFIQKSEKMALLGEMAAGIAHEIRNPLTSIKGFIQLLKADDSKNIFLDIVLSEIDRINGIVGELLFLAKPTAEMYVQKDIKGIIHNVVTLISTQSSLHNIQIVVEEEEELPFISCIEPRLKQVFINLLQNAIEAMPNGGFIRINLQNHVVKGNVIIHISDEGIGIPKKRIEKLGEPFYTTKEKGTGLGLMTCYKIIESHKGQLTIQSEQNKGTTVTITLPTATITEGLSLNILTH